MRNVDLRPDTFRWAAVVMAIFLVGLLAIFVATTPDDQLQGVSCPVPERTETVAEPEALIRKFERTVFWVDTQPPSPVEFIRKWRIPIRLGVDKVPPRFLAHVEELALTLSCLSGIDVLTTWADDHLKSNLWINVVSRGKLLSEIEEALKSEMNPADVKREVIREVREVLTCNGEVWQHEHRYFDGYILFIDDIPDELFGSCLVEEITQAMGLTSDSEIIEHSIFRNEGPLLGYLPLNDKILVRALYDPRIKPGMTREEAMKVAARIIPGLVAAVKAHGVEALYQR